MCQSLVHVSFVNVLRHLFRKLLWAVGQTYITAAIQPRQVVDSGKENQNQVSLKPIEGVIDIRVRTGRLFSLWTYILFGSILLQCHLQLPDDQAEEDANQSQQNIVGDLRAFQTNW